MVYQYNLRGRIITIAEPPASYEAHSGAIDGWWGPITSSIDWCERNYVVSDYVAEFFNAGSNALMIILGIYGAMCALTHGHERRFVVVFACLAFVGVGSLAFHGTLTHVGQQGDETPMVFLSAASLYITVWMTPAKGTRQVAQRGAWIRGLVLLCAVFSVVHYRYCFVLSFQISMAIINIYLMWRQSVLAAASSDRCGAAKRLSRAQSIFLLSAFALWNVDQHFCLALHTMPHGLPNPQFHAWWHVLVSIGAHCGIVSMQFLRAEQLRRAPRITWVGGMLPVCVLAEDSAVQGGGGVRLRRSPRLAKKRARA